MMSRVQAKRLFDVCGASLGLLVLLPLGLVLGLLIKLADGGPVFYRQVRVGQFGKLFRICKFRSMVVEAERMGALVTGADDGRMTLLGRLMRKTKLDELPQLWNVLTGDMSFVGPRPEVPRYVKLYTPEQREILNYKPGITDLATLLFRNEEALLRGAEDLERFYVRYCLPRKIELNRQYAATSNLGRDLGIILRTVCPGWFGVLVVYLIILTLSFWLSFQMRVDMGVTGPAADSFLQVLPWVLVPQLVSLAWQRQMHGFLSYFRAPELRRTGVALTVGFLVLLGLSWSRRGGTLLSPSFLLVDSLLSFCLISALRLGLQWSRERAFHRGEHRLPPRRVAIVGTGEMATRLALDLTPSERSGRRVVAFFDDNPRTWNHWLHDIPVVGMPECLLNQDWLGKVDEVLLALPEQAARRREELAQLLSCWPLTVVRRSGAPGDTEGTWPGDLHRGFRYRPKTSKALSS